MRYCVIYWHIPRDWKNPTDMNNSMQRSVLSALYISAEYKTFPIETTDLQINLKLLSNWMP